MIDIAKNLTDDVIASSKKGRQAGKEDWRGGFNDLVMNRVSSISEIINLLERIGEQGEGLSTFGHGDNSHFKDLFDLYKEAKAYEDGNGVDSLSLPLPINPSVVNIDSKGYIKNKLANAWGDIFNHRYRCLLTSIYHFFHLKDSSLQQIVRSWAFEDMRLLSTISEKMVTLPISSSPGNEILAAPPFELPYTLNLPSENFALWKHHLMLFDHGLFQLQLYSLQGKEAHMITEIHKKRIQQIRELTGNNSI